MVVPLFLQEYIQVHILQLSPDLGVSDAIFIVLSCREEPAVVGAGFRVSLPILNTLAREMRISLKLLCCRSRTSLMQPLPPYMPNVRKWRGHGGCGLQVYHPSDVAAGDERGTGTQGL